MDSVKITKEGILNSSMFLNEVYFWTDTIKDWKPLLDQDKFKKIIVDSWLTLVQRKKIAIYGFVPIAIGMPNHLHVIWEMLSMNGKEMPHASFNKFTSHQFLECLRVEHATLDFQVQDSTERLHRFWQRDPLAINMDSRDKVEQKLTYIHLNPLQAHWNLTDKPENYYWSSTLYYENGVD